MDRGCACRQRDYLLMSDLSDFIVSRVRIKLLQVLLSSPEELFYVRQLGRKIDEEINAVRRELLHLAKVGILKSQPRGNRSYFWANKDYLYYPELLALAAKSTGLGQAIIKHKDKLGRIVFSFMSMRLAKRLAVKTGQVDLLIVGDLDLERLQQAIKNFENQIGREINYTYMPKDEFLYRQEVKDRFLNSLLSADKVVLINDIVKDL